MSLVVSSPAHIFCSIILLWYMVYGKILTGILMQVLHQLELKTGVKVTDIFDWIVGTSTGGILALGLVYG